MKVTYQLQCNYTTIVLYLHLQFFRRKFVDKFVDSPEAITRILIPPKTSSDVHNLPQPLQMWIVCLSNWIGHQDEYPFLQVLYKVALLCTGIYLNLIWFVGFYQNLVFFLKRKVLVWLRHAWSQALLNLGGVRMEHVLFWLLMTRITVYKSD